MATNDEILFGRIAVLSKFVSQEQVDECIEIQERSDEEQPLHLGTILVDQGYLTEREKRAILQVQKENLQRREAGTSARRQERIFGYLVMKLGNCTEQQVFECVREQAKLMRLNLIFKLGEVFVSKGYLGFEQVEEVLALQDKFIVTCSGCATKFNVVRYQAGTRVKCPECGTVIEVPDILGEVSAQKKAEAQAKAALRDQEDIDDTDGAVEKAGAAAATPEAKPVRASADAETRKIPAREVMGTDTDTNVTDERGAEPAEPAAVEHDASDERTPDPVSGARPTSSGDGGTEASA